MSPRPRLLPAAVATLLVVLASRVAAQQVINLDAVIGAAGTDAVSVAVAGNAVNFVGIAGNNGATLLTAAGSAGSSSFDFNGGFADQVDRAVGANPNSGAAHVYADRKYDSGTPSPLILDTSNDGTFSGSALPGFGMHGDGFITFDLDTIRSQFALAPGTPFLLTGLAGMANAPLSYQTSGAIIADSAQLAVFDWGVGHGIDAFSIPVSGSTRYLTFSGLSGSDGSETYAHVGYGNVQLTVAVPEPGSAALLALGGAGLALRRRLFARAVPPRLD